MSPTMLSTQPPRSWRLLPAADEDVRRLARAVDLPPVAARLLVQRGLGDADQARRFLQARAMDLHDPDGLPGMAAACARLERAIRDGETLGPPRR